ncbi:MAG: phenylalanine--tRNA ligase subunit beta [Tissierellia bacterium]|nr:phenylalanine--tRNA ligase subunit beta [Tissierellia bacterium]
MLLPIEWLNDYVDIKENNRTLADGLTLSGSHVESIQSKDDIKGVYTGLITKITSHPDADKLRICTLDLGDLGVRQIVTGATNVQEGHIVPVALSGAVLANDLNIVDSQLRGVESQGMLCSFEELGYSESVIPKESKDGIMIFTEEVSLGEDVTKLFHMDRGIIEFEITPNRPDCLGILGMAKETAATFDIEYNPPIMDSYCQSKECDIKVSVETEGCFRYIGRVLENVKIEPSPLWMQLRLMEAGMRPINNVVDISNYVMLEYNQPLHAFDADEIAAGKIVVRQGKTGEQLTTLDGVVRDIEESDILIADGEKILGFAGIMGGLIGEVTAGTKRIFLESANFNERPIRLTSKRLALRTEASTRFEKGLDPNTAILAANRFCQLMENVGAGTVVGGESDHYPNPVEEKVIELRQERVNHLLGLDLDESYIVGALKRLGMESQVKDGLIYVTVPTVRGDIVKEVDLIEEVGRIYGFHKIAPKALHGELTEGGRSPVRDKCDSVRDLLVSIGYNQILTYSFISPKTYDKIMLSPQDPIRESLIIMNPLGEDFSIMRRTQIPNMLDVLARNANRGLEKFKGFEIGRIFIGKDEQMIEDPHERLTLSLGVYGYDFYEAKEAITLLAERTGINKLSFTRCEENPTFHPGRTANVYIDEKFIGRVGEIHPLVQDNYGSKKSFVVAELDLEAMVEHMDDRRTYSPLPKYPAMQRDLAAVVDEEIMLCQIEDIVIANGQEMLEDFMLFDIYRGNQIPEGKKSVAFSITFRNKNRTLKEEEVSDIMEKIKDDLESRLDANWRL